MTQRKPSAPNADTAEARRIMHRLATAGMNHDRLPMLDVVFDRSVQMITESFLHLMSTEVQVVLEELSYCRFGDAMEEAGRHTVIAIVNAKEWDASFLIVMDGSLVFKLVEMLLGGAPAESASYDPDRRPTAIEMQLARRIMRLAAQRFADAFGTISPITFEIDRLELNPHFAAITRTTSAAVSAHLNLSVASARGSLRAVFPYAAFEPIKTQLQQMFMGERFGKDASWEQHFAGCLARTPLTLEAVLHQELVSLAGLLDWRPGTTLVFDADAEAQVRLIHEGEEFFRGPMGRKGTRIAAQIETATFREESETDALPSAKGRAA